MKKLLLFLAIILMACEPEETEGECYCVIEGIRYISFNQGASWDVNEIDGRSGMEMPCYYDEMESNQVYGENVWYKIVWKCKD